MAPFPRPDALDLLAVEQCGFSAMYGCAAVSDEKLTPDQLRREVESLRAQVEGHRAHAQDLEDALRRTAARYQLLADALPGGYFRLSSAGSFLEFTPSLAVMLGYTSATGPGGPMPPSAMAPVAAVLESALRDRIKTSGSPVTVEIRLPRSDGRRIWASVRARACAEGEGLPDSYEGHVADVSPAKLADAVLDLQRQFLDVVRSGLALPEVLAVLVRGVGGHPADQPCAVFLHDDEANQLRPVASVGVAPDVLSAMAPDLIGPQPASAGATIHSEEPLSVADVPSDPTWAGHPVGEAAVAAGLRAWYSTPIRCRDGRRGGTFVLFNTRPLLPDPGAVQLVDVAARLGALAIDRQRMNDLVAHRTEALEETERLAHVGGWSWNLVTGQLSVSVELARILGTRAQDGVMTFDAFVGCLHPDDRLVLRTRIDRALADRRPFDHLLRVVRQPGLIRNIRLRGRVVAGKSDLPAQLVGTVQDLTEWRRAEEALDATRRSGQAIFEYALDAIVLFNDSGQVIEGNPAACQLLGYRRDELPGLTINDLTPAHPRGHPAALLKQLLSSAADFGEYEVLGKDGVIRDVECRSVANILPGLHVTIQREISDRVRAEAATIRLRDFYQGVLDDFPIPIWRSTADGNCDYFNQTWLAFTGRARDQETGRGWVVGIHPEDVGDCLEGYYDAFFARLMDDDYRSLSATIRNPSPTTTSDD